MIVLEAKNLHWIGGVADDPFDYCAHGDVEFRIDQDVLLTGDTGNDLTVSAAALYLLRTLTTQHIIDESKSHRLFPHCGMEYSHNPDGPEVILFECDTGVDFSVSSDVNKTRVIIRNVQGRNGQ